jgi:phage replication-related protein YjqB (UPF0714/DUF867 family)
MADKYKNFNELAQHEIEGQDFEIAYRESGSIFLVIAMHGGAIESGTSEIADAIAGKNFSFYTFRGIKEHGNADLHITSTYFDEPRVISLLRRSKFSITVHGRNKKDQIVYVGGLHLQLKEQIVNALKDADFRATHQDYPAFKGLNAKNLCNQGQSKTGVQLEISRGLRETFFKSSGGKGEVGHTESFDKFIGAVRNVLLMWQKESGNGI